MAGAEFGYPGLGFRVRGFGGRGSWRLYALVPETSQESLPLTLRRLRDTGTCVNAFRAGIRMFEQGLGFVGFTLNPKP